MKDIRLKDGTRVTYASKSVGEGGMAEVFRVTGPAKLAGAVVKIFKRPDDPEYSKDPEMQRAVALAHQERQHRLPKLLTLSLPPRVVVPKALCYDSRGEIVGCIFPFVHSYGTLKRVNVPGERKKLRLPAAVMVRYLVSLRDTLKALHACGVVIGDFTANNVLLGRDGNAYAIDVDAFQFGGYKTKEYTPHYVDPLVCDPSRTEMVAARPHSTETDWYAFAIIAFQTLCMVDPFDGAYRPSNPAKRINKEAVRRFRRITVYDPEVRFPKHGLHFSGLPDELNRYFKAVLLNGLRAPMANHLLDTLRATACGCGIQHFSSKCPGCGTQQLEIRQVFQTSGHIVHVSLSPAGTPNVITNSRNQVKREDGGAVFAGAIAPREQAAVWNDQTVVVRDGHLEIYGGGSVTRIPVASYEGNPLVTVSPTGYIYAEGDKIVCRGRKSSAELSGVPYVVAGLCGVHTYGIGLTAPGPVLGTQSFFVFDFEAGTISPPIRINYPGEWVSGLHCVFAGGGKIWAVFEARSLLTRRSRCLILRKDGTIEFAGPLPANLPVETWMGACGHPAKNSVFCSTDEGMKEVALEGERLVVRDYLPEARQLVDRNTKILMGQSSLPVYLVRRQDILRVGL